MKILVTDGHLKTTLAAVRALGRRGLDVHTTHHRPGTTLCSLSTFNRRTHILPSYQEEEQFDAQFLDLLRAEHFDYLLLASDGAVKRVSANRERVLALTRVDLPPPAAVNRVVSKVGLLEFASEIGYPIPKTVIHRRADPTENIVDVLSFPMVAKISSGSSYDRVRYLNRVDDLMSFVSSVHSDDPIIVQEYVDGVGYGLFALFDRGKPLLYHAHERVWEYPPTGGPSVLSRIVHDRRLEELGLELLERLEWNGLAMVEFRKAHSDGRYRLMEINPRLWGSLALSIAAGADFPYLAACVDRTDLAQSMVVRNTTFLWIVPDGVLFVLARPSKFVSLIRALVSRRVKKDVVIDDLKPLSRQMREALYWVKTLSPQGRLREPHGRPARDVGFSFDLHIHSERSHDSLSSLRRILRRAEHLRLSAVAVTDHESIDGGMRAREMNQNPHLFVIVGSEIRTEIGDIIGLFLETEIKSRSAREVIREIKAQGGLVLLPHPFSYGITDYDETILRAIDLIELRNSRNWTEQLDRVLQYAVRYALTLVGNSDAHFVSEIGSTRNVAARSPAPGESLKDFIRRGTFRIVQSKTKHHRFLLSQAIKNMKRRRYREAMRFCRWSGQAFVEDVSRPMFGGLSTMAADGD